MTWRSPARLGACGSRRPRLAKVVPDEAGDSRQASTGSVRMSHPAEGTLLAVGCAPSPMVTTQREIR